MLVIANGLPSHMRPITFSTTKTIDYKNLHANDYVPEEGTQEFYDSHRIVSVTRDGYEYTESLEEVMARLLAATIEDMNESPTNDNPSLQQEDPTSVDPEDPTLVPSGQDRVFQVLADAMRKQMPEKRSVIGDDTRVKVSPSRFPFTAIGRVDIGCTGTFIAPKTVLTSAHCVHEGGSSGQWYQNIDVRRQKDCDPNNGVLHNMNKAVTLNGWLTNKLQAYDVALIFVSESSPVTMPFTSSGVIPLDTVNIIGYPGDKPGWCMWGSFCTLAEADNSFLRYPCDTAGGMSGSAVYYYYKSTNTRIIRGVHGYGVGSSGYNTAIRITPQIEDFIRTKITANGGN